MTQMFHVNRVSVIPDGINILVERLVDTLTGRDIPQFRVDHFNNFEDGLFIIVSDDGEKDLRKLKEYRTEIEDAVVSIRNEFGLEHFSGKWLICAE